MGDPMRIIYRNFATTVVFTTTHICIVSEIPDGLKRATTSLRRLSRCGMGVDMTVRIDSYGVLLYY